MLRNVLPAVVLLASAPGDVAAAPPVARSADASQPAWDRPILADPKRDDAAKARRPRTFRDHGVGPTIDTAERPRGAFTLDHDTASFDLARAALARGEMPQPAEVRVEEFIKVFAAPPEDATADRRDPLGIETEAVASPHRRGYQLVRITAYAAPRPQRPVDIVIAVDVSSAMATAPDLDDARELVQTLGAALSRDDKLAVVELGSPPEVLLPLQPPPSLAELEATVERIGPAEAPAVSEATLATAYAQLAAKDPKRDRVIVLVGPGSLPASSAEHRDAVWSAADQAMRRGISSFSVGIGRATYDDVLLGGFASAGHGAYLFTHEPSDTARQLAQLVRRPIAARDPVLEVEFDPAAVTRYRLLGFEGRSEPAPARREQPNAGALRAGEAVTALYEIKLREDAPASWGEARLRYQSPNSKKTRALAQPLEGLKAGVSPADASPSTQLVVLAATVAEKLRASYWARRVTWVALRERWDALPEDVRTDPDTARLGALIDDAAALQAEPSEDDSDARPFDRMPVVR